MSGDENASNNPAQLSEFNKGRVDCKEPSDAKELCSFDGVTSGAGFDLGVGDGGYGGDIENWGLDQVQTVGGVFDIFDTSFQGNEQPEMGNHFGKSSGVEQPGHGNVFSAEEGDERMSCEPVEDDSKGMHCDENGPGMSFGVVGTEGEVPHHDSCDGARNGGDNVSNCSNEMTGEIILSPREVEEKTYGSWESVFEVARESEEIVGCIPTGYDQHMLSHESAAGEPSLVLNAFECPEFETTPGAVSAASEDLVSRNSTPEDTVVEPVEDSSKNDHGKCIHLIEPVCASNVVTDPACMESMIDGVRLDEEPKIEGEDTVLSIHDELIEQKENPTLEAEQDNALKEKTCATEEVGKSRHDVGKNSGVIVERNEKASLSDQSRQLLQQVGAEGYVVVLGMPAIDPTVKPFCFRSPAIASQKQQGRKSGIASETAIKRSSRLASSSSLKVSQSTSLEHSISPEPIPKVENTRDSFIERRGRKKKEIKGEFDEFSKMRKHLRYFLHKIRYEQNLLDAYSSEGWRGQSIEKLRPEKELQRAKTDMNRWKVKIRELFHRLDSMSTEGKIPDSLYDSEGLIDSEDIFCAKCGTKELIAGNDIVLCDGSCERGFHQYCLDPPLKTEEIPPGDEGWFCPACDCKFDCIDLLNDSHGVKLSIEDSWEIVFPEAVAAVAGLKQDDMLGLPSDDSEDNDYNPDGQDDDLKDDGKKTSSDESESDESDPSDFSSASEDLGAVCKDDQYLGLPSDDPDDDDFDPDAANANDVDNECASSSSDFTSASEDLRASVSNDEALENEGASVSNDEALENEGPSLPAEPDEHLDDSLPLSGRRQVERLDYKKLFDETYGNGDSDSSDEEWTDGDVSTKRKTSAKREVSVSANGAVSASETCLTAASRRRGRPKRDHPVKNTSTVEPEKTTQETSSGSKSRKRPPYNKIPESVTQRLYEAFKEVQYPDRSTKEKLAEELGITPAKVDKWFGNARWSLRHHPSRVEASISQVVPGGAILLTQLGGADSSKSDKGSSGRKISTPQNTRKREVEEEELQTSKIDISQESDGVDTSKLSTKAEPSETPKTLGQGQRKRRKSGV